MTTSAELVPVEQVDRDAAAALIWKLNWYSAEKRDIIRDGKNDTHPVVEAFARHRLAAISLTLEEAARVADDAATEVSIRIDNMVRIRSAQRRIDAQKERRVGLQNIAQSLRSMALAQDRSGG
jgi:hypothetical protein